MCATAYDTVRILIIMKSTFHNMDLLPFHLINLAMLIINSS
ncbi:MAG: hypothetical protein RIQ62_1568 [Bacteroidota bacterium]|jgi:hypothetical protein